MNLHRLLPILALAIATAPFARAENPQVAALAKEGHWVATGWAAHSPMLGQPAPRLELSEWINGEITPQSMKGKIVVVDFWATWCGPCRRAIPHNNELLKRYASKGVLIFGACGSGRGEEKMAETLKELKAEYPNARASKGTTEAWKVQWWPTYAVIDRQGKVRALGIQPEYVEKVIDALLVEQPAQ
jgi:thiol-disulfide isomerase/thioredoxin